MMAARSPVPPARYRSPARSPGLWLCCVVTHHDPRARPPSESTLGERTTVTTSGASGRQFKGFLVQVRLLLCKHCNGRPQARDAAGKVIGTFEIISESLCHFKHCCFIFTRLSQRVDDSPYNAADPEDAQHLASTAECGDRGTVTHINNARKSEVVLSWTPPGR